MTITTVEVRGVQKRFGRTSALAARSTGRPAITASGCILVFWQFGALADAHGQLL